MAQRSKVDGWVPLANAAGIFPVEDILAPMGCDVEPSLRLLWGPLRRSLP